MIAAPLVRELLLSGEQALMTGVDLAETLDRMMRHQGVSRVAVEPDVLALGVTITAVDNAMAFDATLLGLIADENGRYLALPDSQGHNWALA